VTQTAIAWARQSRSEPQRATRLKTVIRFARFSRATDRRHELPPTGYSTRNASVRSPISLASRRFRR
jgi:hypothetical protein